MIIAKHVHDKIKITPGGCWEWCGCRNSDGYGNISVDKKIWRAHRYVYTEIKGAIPAGLELDHLCRNRACVNPDHLQPVTHRVNMKRSPVVGKHELRKTHCPKGHPYSGANLRTTKMGHRQCRKCQQIKNYARYYKNRDRSTIMPSTLKHIDQLAGRKAKS